MRISDIATRHNTFSARRSVYSGQERLGDVEQRGRDFIARDRRGKSIGTFDTMIEAVNAIGKAVTP